MNFTGKYKMVSSDNFDEYMKELGVGFATRKMAATLIPTQEIAHEGDEINIKTISTFKTTEIKGKIGQEFDEETADGRKVKTTFTVAGNKMVQDQKGEKPSTLTREFNGDEMKMTLKANDVICTRTYKKI